MRAFFPGFHWPKFHKCEQEPHPHPCLCKNNQVLTNSRELMNWTIWIHMLELEMVQYHRQDCTIYADVAVRKCLRTRWRKTFRRPETKWLFRTCSNYFLVSEIAVVFQSLNLNVPCIALQSWNRAFSGCERRRSRARLHSRQRCHWPWEDWKTTNKDTMDQPVGLPTALPGVEDSGRWAGDGRWDYEKVLDVVKQWT